MKKVRYLGIDPGSNDMGFAVIEVMNRKVRVIEIGVIRMERKQLQQEKLHAIYKRLGDLIELYLPSEMAIEAPFFGKNVQSMLKLGRAQGVAIASGMSHNLTITEYTPRKIKKAVTGNGNATKAQVSAMLEQLLEYSMEGVAHDATDALATAFCHHLAASNPVAKLSSAKSWDRFIRENPNRIKST